MSQNTFSQSSYRIWIKLVGLLDTKYGRPRTEKVEEAVEDLLKLKEDPFEDDDDLILVMKELNQR